MKILSFITLLLAQFDWRHRLLIIAVYGIGALTTNGLAKPVNQTQLLGACTGCHGKQGRATPDGFLPRIAGKPQVYLFNQLRHFRNGRRSNRAMADLLRVLDDAALSKLAGRFATQNLPYPPPTPAPDLNNEAVARARALVHEGDAARDIPACAACHGRHLMGDGRGVPPLLGLPRDYLIAQMGAWRNRTRDAGEHDCMADIAARMSTAQIVSSSAWLSSQPVPENAPPQSGDEEPPMRCGSFETQLPAARTPVATGRGDTTISRGAYLARAGNCASCHLGRQGQPYAGGRPVATPFGSVYASNLTPDPKTGLGSWQADDFWQAMHRGQSRNKRLLFPAFPYLQYTAMTRDDSDALFEYLQSLPPIASEVSKPGIPFPLNTQLALRLWRWLYFEPDTFSVDPGASEAVNRGHYLVEVLGHCSACHGKRGLLGGPDSSARWDGQMMPGNRWYAPSLTRRDEAGVQHLSDNQVMALLRGDRSAPQSLTGPMADVVHNSTAHLSATDLQAMAAYLRQLPQVAAPGASSPNPDRPVSKSGERLYRQHCADCHGRDGAGDDAIGALAGNRQVLHSNVANLVSIVVQGGFQPATADNPDPLGMPPFGPVLNAGEIASVLTYIRGAWGNNAAPVSTTGVLRHQ